MREAGTGDTAIGKGAEGCSLRPTYGIIGSTIGARTSVGRPWSVGVVLVPRLRAAHVEHHLGGWWWTRVGMARTDHEATVAEAAVGCSAIVGRVGALPGCDALFGLCGTGQRCNAGSRRIMVAMHGFG